MNDNEITEQTSDRINIKYVIIPFQYVVGGFYNIVSMSDLNLDNFAKKNL